MALVLRATHYPMPAWQSRGCADLGCADSPNDDRAEHAQHDPKAARAKSAPGRKGCVLLVDDDRAVRETLAELLDDVGFHSVQASDASEALLILRRGEAIDVLVTDLTMPGDDGISLIRQARAIRNDLPAVLLTGYAEEVTSVSTIAGGNFHVLRKPVESERLIQQLELLVIKPVD
jgi:CheY-like chemotaxis protein